MDIVRDGFHMDKTFHTDLCPDHPLRQEPSDQCEQSEGTYRLEQCVMFQKHRNPPPHMHVYLSGRIALQIFCQMAMEMETGVLKGEPVLPV